MDLKEILTSFIIGIQQTTALEYIAVFTGIASTFLSKKENIWVFPTGIISTTIYIWISLHGHLFAEAGLNIYYTIMSMIGWFMWTHKSSDTAQPLVITKANSKDWKQSLLFFAIIYILLVFILIKWTPSTVPQMDALASASAYTAMFLMNRKKIENWYWWILADLISMPLYFSKGYVFTSFQFFVFLLICISGLKSWKLKLKQLQH